MIHLNDLVEIEAPTLCCRAGHDLNYNRNFSLKYFLRQEITSIVIMLMLLAFGWHSPTAEAWQHSARAIAQEFELSDWQVSLDGGTIFQPIKVPGTIEDQIDVDFDGVSIYQTTLPEISLVSGQRFWISFEGVATEATVYLNDQLVGKHLGAWTPFHLDLTDALNPSTATEKNDHQTPSRLLRSVGNHLKVLVDEKVGHNTQGFLPVITHHFGGIWKPVRCAVRESVIIDKDAVVFRRRFDPQRIEVEIPVVHHPDIDLNFAIFIRPAVNSASNEVEDSRERSGSRPTAVANKANNENWVQLTAVSQTRTSTQPNVGGLPVDTALHSNSPLCRSQFLLHGNLDDIPFSIEPWSLDDPQRYQFKVDVSRIGVSNQPGQIQQPRAVVDSTEKSLGFRDFEIDQDGFMLNGNPIVPRGLLNWGYAPPSVAPSLDEAWFRQEIEFAKERGFNMMKFCLWVPPQRYLELCDELGILVWMEYPTWHPKLDQQHLADLEREYREFYHYDRNFASIVFRSLTCETGPSADLSVIQRLYDLGKELIPDAIIVDDSSWISWNRIHDFYDDHPYGNNHTWRNKLKELAAYIDKKGIKPLVLGEAIAADTWTVPTPDLIALGKSSPAHAPWFVADNLRWQQAMQQLAISRNSRFMVDNLWPRSRHYAMLMRKFQIETFHQEIPHGGYTISVIRDFPKAAMGLIDFENRPKFSVADWSFHRDTMLLLKTDSDRRSFPAGSEHPFELILKNDGPQVLLNGKLELSLLQAPLNRQGISTFDDDSMVPSDRDPMGRGAGELALTSNLKTIDFASVALSNVQPGTSEETLFQLSLPQVSTPQRFLLRGTWEYRNETFINEWPIWVFPSTGQIVATDKQQNAPEAQVGFHGSLSPLIPKLTTKYSVVDSTLLQPAMQRNGIAGLPKVIVTGHLDKTLLEYLKQGGSVIMLPDNQPGSFPLTEHWFLRGAPATFDHPSRTWNPTFLLNQQGKLNQLTMIDELQHFDLAGSVIPEVDSFISYADPWLVLWDNHDRRDVRTHGLVFEMPVGEGTLFVSALKHHDLSNTVGQWLLQHWIDRLATQTRSPQTKDAEQHAAEVATRLHQAIHRQEIDLQHESWKFQPVDRFDGTLSSELSINQIQKMAESWAQAEFDDRHWDNIRIDRHWESQGYASLDHWAWYRKQVEVPEDWNDRIYLNFRGVDDFAMIYVNGKQIGTIGDLENQITGFDQRVSFDVSQDFIPGKPITIAVAIYDWYGAGGIFRPVTLTTMPDGDNPPWLK